MDEMIIFERVDKMCFQKRLYCSNLSPNRHSNNSEFRSIFLRTSLVFRILKRLFSSRYLNPRKCRISGSCNVKILNFYFLQSWDSKKFRIAIFIVFFYKFYALYRFFIHSEGKCIENT